MERLIYLSESRIDPKDADEIISGLIFDAQNKNAELELTGALFFTENYFAQILEGPRDSIATLMRSIRVDVRHSNIKIVEQSPISNRRFARWLMAYHGPSQFVTRHVARLLHNPTKSEQRRATERLTQLAAEFSVLNPPN